MPFRSTPGGTDDPGSGGTPAPRAHGHRSRVALAIGLALLALGGVAVLLRRSSTLQQMNRYTVMASAFIPYGILAFAAATVIFATARRRRIRVLAVVAMAGLLVQLWWARPYWPRPAPAPASGSAQLTLVTMNLRCNPEGIDDLAALGQQTRAQVVVVEGLRFDKVDALAKAWPHLPYRAVHRVVQQPTCGSVVFSSTPVEETSTSDDVQPVVRLELPEGPLVLLPVDFPNPSTTGVAAWLAAFSRLTDAVRSHSGSTLVAVGDFNAVREHIPMRLLLQNTGLRDAAEVAGAGWRPTFPSERWHPPLIGLDHALISPQLGARSATTNEISGQEHRAVVFDLTLPGGSR